MSVNYGTELEKILKKEETKGKRLVLHSCCAPCSSYVLEYLRQYFKITVFYYNPNITQEPEYLKRVQEQKRLIQAYNNRLSQSLLTNKTKESCSVFPIEIIEGEYEREVFLREVKGMEQCPEGGERCEICFRLRLSETAKLAKKLSADYFCTTLTVSPLKSAEKLNTIGQELAADIGVAFLPSDFKKKNGYQRTIELSREFGLYRQDYCGCIYSKAEREEQKEKLAKNGL